MIPERMPEALLAGIFPKGIVVISEEFTGASLPEQNSPPQAPASPVQEGTMPVRPEVTVAYQYLGGFGKKVLVVVHDPTSLHLNQQDLEFLGKIIGAVKLSMADIALVNAATQQPEYYALQEQLPASVALYFGIEPATIGAPVKFPQFQVQQWNHCTFLFAPDFDALSPFASNAVALKKELWAALKKIFPL